MKIDSSTAPIPASVPNATEAATSQQEFLNLLVAQLKNQNPLDPQDGAEFVAQLAQFSSLEQATQTNQRLEGIQAEQASAATASLASFVGRTATAGASTFRIEDGSQVPPPLSAKLEDAIESGEAIITNAAGEEVRRIALGPQPAGEVVVPWDTKTPPRPLDAGTYRVEIKTTTTGGQEATAIPRFEGLVTALDLTTGLPRLRIGNLTVAPGDVLAIQ